MATKKKTAGQRRRDEQTGHESAIDDIIEDSVIPKLEGFVQEPPDSPLQVAYLLACCHVLVALSALKRRKKPA